MDTGATSHMSNAPGTFPHLTRSMFNSSITVGNGARLPVSHMAAASIPTHSTPLHLNNVLISPSLVKNLISVRKLTCDNNVSIEFDPRGFSVKDLPTSQVMLRCESSGDLYPLQLMFGQHLSSVFQGLNTILCYLMTLLTMSGRSPSVLSLMCFLLFALSTPISPPNSVFPCSRFKRTMAKSSNLTPCARSSLPTASRFACLVRIPCNKMGRLSGYFERRTIVFVPFLFIVQLQRHSGPRHCPQRRT